MTWDYAPGLPPLGITFTQVMGLTGVIIKHVLAYVLTREGATCLTVLTKPKGAGPGNRRGCL